MEILFAIADLACVTLIVFFVIYWVAYPILFAPFSISSVKDILTMFELANLSSNDKAIDLGSGDGRVALAASRVSKSAVGIEHNPFLTLYSRFMSLISTNGDVVFKHKDIWKENLASYDVVFIYLTGTYLNKLKHKLDRELAPGSRVVTKNYDLKGWKPTKQIDNKYFLYIIGKHS